MNLIAMIPAGIDAVTVNGLHQWDYGRELEIHSADLPALVEVHFACPGMNEAIVRVGSAVDGTVAVAIPDRCLEQSAPITAWVFEIGENNGQTIKTLTLNVTPRVRPQMAPSLDPEIADKYTEAVGAMNETIEKMPERFLLKEGGRISGRLFVDGDNFGVGGTTPSPTSSTVSYLRGNSEVNGANIVDVIGLFGNGSNANGATTGKTDPSKWGIRGLYDSQVGNVIEIGKDNKAKFFGEADKAKSADTAQSANTATSSNYSGGLATEIVDKPAYNEITREGLYCVVIKDEDDQDNTIYRTLMIYAKNPKSVVEDALSGYVLVYENNSFKLDKNGFDISDKIQNCYLICSSWGIG